MYTHHCRNQVWARQEKIWDANPGCMGIITSSSSYLPRNVSVNVAWSSIQPPQTPMFRRHFLPSHCVLLAAIACLWAKQASNFAKINLGIHQIQDTMHASRQERPQGTGSEVRTSRRSELGHQPSSDSSDTSTRISLKC